MSTAKSALIKGLGPQNHHAIGKAAQLPGRASGQYMSIAPITLSSPGRPVPLNLRITAPVTGDNLPIILLAHGAGPSNNLNSLNGYLPTSQFYAAQGFVVIQPTHLDSRSLSLPSDTPGAPLFWQSRVRDMKNILDHLSDLETAVPSIKGRLDHSRIVAWGHSMGAHTAGMLLGLRCTDDGKEHILADSRVKLGVYMAGLSSGENVPDTAVAKYPFAAGTKFDGMKTPTLVVTGDKDDSPHLSKVGWKGHTDAYHRSPGSKDLLVMYGGNHSFGGISGWDSTDCALFNEESPEMCEAVLRLTLAYMKSKLYGDDSWDQARAALDETRLGYIESK